MGVDIYGRNPKLVGERPTIDFKNSSKEEEEKYFADIDDFEDRNPGYYFRSNWWGWRPIVAITDIACKRSKVRVDLSKWGENSGAGPRSQKKCDEIADAIESYLVDEIDYLKEDIDRLYICLGSWCTPEGRFLDNGKEEILNEQYNYGQILHNSVVMDDGTIVESAHSCSRSHIDYFINFLRHCGGFRIF